MIWWETGGGGFLNGKRKGGQPRSPLPRCRSGIQAEINQPGASVTKPQVPSSSHCISDHRLKLPGFIHVQIHAVLALKCVKTHLSSANTTVPHPQDNQNKQYPFSSRLRADYHPHTHPHTKSHDAPGTHIQAHDSLLLPTPNPAQIRKTHRSSSRSVPLSLSSPPEIMFRPNLKIIIKNSIRNPPPRNPPLQSPPLFFSSILIISISIHRRQ